MGVILAFLAGFLLLTVLGLLAVVAAVRVRRAEPRPPGGQVDLITRGQLLDHRVLTRLREAYDAHRVAHPR